LQRKTPNNDNPLELMGKYNMHLAIFVKREIAFKTKASKNEICLVENQHFQ